MAGTTEEQIMELAQLAYGEPMPDSYKRACKHDSGDGLADFIVIELHEATEGEKYKLLRAIEVMERARDQLEHIVRALQDVQQFGFEKTKKAWSGE
jgi:hypothetical protein